MDAKNKKVMSVFEKVFHDASLVEKIIKNIPLRNRWNLAASDKKLYSIICDLDAYKHKMKIVNNHVSTL